MKPKLLIIDDEDGICVSLSLALAPQYDTAWETGPAEGLERLRAERYDLVLLDMMIGKHDGLETLREIKRMDARIAVIVMTAYGSIRSSVKAMQHGAFTYLSKPLDLEELQIHMRQALEFRRLGEKVDYLNDALKTRYQYSGMIGKSPSMQEVYRMIEKLGEVDASVTISGESGTGKELVAKAIHFSGKRRDERFVAVNCAAIPDGLLEEEFFGHKRGSFTGAMNDKRGKFEIADKGTLFFDEVGDMPPSLQGKLLRALQEKAFSPIGSHETHSFDVRVIAATNRDLKAMVQKSVFRQDLYYRLNVVEIKLPPLRERREDIPLLCEHFIGINNQQHGNSIKGLTKEAERFLLAYHYPGNVRELANILEYASIVSAGDWIDVGDLPKVAVDDPGAGDDLDRHIAGMTLKELERAAITASYRRNGGKRRTMASELGISDRGLWNKLREYGLNHKAE